MSSPLHSHCTAHAIPAHNRKHTLWNCTFTMHYGCIKYWNSGLLWKWVTMHQKINYKKRRNIQSYFPTFIPRSLFACHPKTWNVLSFHFYLQTLILVQYPTVVIFWGPKYSENKQILEEHQQHAHAHLSDLFCFGKFTASETPHSQTTEWWWHQVDNSSRQGNNWTMSQLTLTPAHFVITWGWCHSTT